MRNLFILTLVAGLAGGLAHSLVHILGQPPMIIGGAIAGSVGYMAAWAMEIHIARCVKTSGHKNGKIRRN